MPFRMMYTIIWLINSQSSRAVLRMVSVLASAFFVKEYFPVRIFWFLIEASVQYLYITTSVVSLLTIRKLGLLNNQQAIEI